MANLYELTEQYQQLEDLATNGTSTAEDMESLLEELNLVEESIEVKVANGIGLIQDLTLLETGIKNEIDRLKQHHNQIQTKIQRIKDWYRQNLEKGGMSKVNTQRGTMSIQRNPMNIVIKNHSKVPEEYFETIPAKKILNREKIKADLKNGKEIPGCSIADTTYHLRIR